MFGPIGVKGPEQVDLQTEEDRREPRAAVGEEVYHKWAFSKGQKCPKTDLW